MPQHSVVVVAPVRTAIGTFGGSLKEIPAPDLGAVAIKASIARAGLDPRVRSRLRLPAAWRIWIWRPI